jgi:hypothetical protein
VRRRVHGDTPPGGFCGYHLSNRKIAAVPWYPMATKNKSADLLASYLGAGFLAFLILLLAAKAGWTLWVILPLIVLVWYYMVHSPRRQRRLTGTPPAGKVVIKPKRAGGLPSRADRRVGWNKLGTLSVRADDPFILIKGESPPDGVAVAVPAGRWQVHVRSEMVTKPIHMRDAELRIVQDTKWKEENWEWTSSWEPQLANDVGSASQSGALAPVAGLLRVHAGRRTRRGSRSLILQPGYAEGAFGVNVVRDPSGKVVAVVSRFG